MNNSQPNIALVVFDSLSASSFNTLLSTLPTLRALNEKSISFDNAYVCSPESSPARASLFTGLDMAAHRVWSDGVELPKRETTLPEVFASNGYQTSLVGRRQLAGVSHWTTEHSRPGEYHQSSWAHGPLHRSRQNAYLTWLQDIEPEIYQRVFPRQPNPDDTHIPARQREAMADLPDTLSFNTWVGQQCCTYLANRASDKPFFSTIGFVVGQTQGAQQGKLAETLNEKALHQADKALAGVLAHCPENTIVVVTAGRGSLTEDNAPELMHNDAIRVPLLIQSPGTTSKAVKAAVSTMDIAPTLFTSATINQPQRTQGTCLLTTPPRGWAFSRLRSSDTQHQSSICNERWKLVMLHADTQVNSPETPSSNYKLYDLQADPNETNNLASSIEQESILEDMIDLMIDARVALEDRTEPRIAKF